MPKGGNGVIQLIIISTPITKGFPRKSCCRYLGKGNGQNNYGTALSIFQYYPGGKGCRYRPRYLTSPGGSSLVSGHLNHARSTSRPTQGPPSNERSLRSP